MYIYPYIYFFFFQHLNLLFHWGNSLLCYPQGNVINQELYRSFHWWGYGIHYPVAAISSMIHIVQWLLGQYQHPIKVVAALQPMHSGDAGCAFSCLVPSVSSVFQTMSYLVIQLILWTTSAQHFCSSLSNQNQFLWFSTKNSARYNECLQDEREDTSTKVMLRSFSPLNYHSQRKT